MNPYLGTNPFDHVMGEGRFNLDMACYDLMGKHLDLPAWKLMGQQVRQWVAMGWWMPCMSPEDTIVEVQVAVKRVYRGLKCKARAFYDVVEQSKAIQTVAPPDFRVEFDFNGSLINVEKALPICESWRRFRLSRVLRSRFSLMMWRGGGGCIRRFGFHFICMVSVLSERVHHVNLRVLGLDCVLGILTVRCVAMRV